MKPILAFLLHCANRNIKSHDKKYVDDFYRVKDVILKRYGKAVGYDVQKIDGKRCNSCGGRGQHPLYSNMPPYKIYDWADCYHCWGGWYRLPKWICLQRLKFGPFLFHKPLKREECVRNPFTEENMGWKVSDGEVIKGYIEHDEHWFGDTAIALLMLVYDKANGRRFINELLYWKRIRLRNRIQSFLRWPLAVRRPVVRTKYEWEDDDDLPF